MARRAAKSTEPVSRRELTQAAADREHASVEEMIDRAEANDWLRSVGPDLDQRTLPLSKLAEWIVDLPLAVAHAASKLNADGERTPPDPRPEAGSADEREHSDPEASDAPADSPAS